MSSPFELTPAEHVLDLAFQALGITCGARVAVAWRREGDQLRLVLGRPVHAYLLGSVEGVWVESRQTLEQGQAVRDASGVYLPLMQEQACVGLLALDIDPARTDRAQRTYVETLLESIRQAVVDSARQERYWPLGSALTQPDALERVERAQLQLTLERCEWNVSWAARELQLSKQALYQRMQKYAISRPRPARQGFAVRPQRRLVEGN